MKIYFFSLILFLFSGFLFAYDPLMDPLNDTYITLYASQRGEEWTVGSFLNIRLAPSLSLQLDSENWLKAFDPQKDVFRPNLIDYGFGLKFDRIGWFHTCMHTISESDAGKDSNRLPIKNRIYWDF